MVMIMKNYFTGFVTLILSAYTLDCTAAWYLTEAPATKLERKIIDDKPRVFKVQNMFCGVEQTEFYRTPDDRVLEFRTLYCWPTQDVYVSTIVTCNMPNWESSKLLIKIKGIGHAPILWCGPQQK
jgi:hypothetical protein